MELQEPCTLTGAWPQIGAGAAGLFAARLAARDGIQVGVVNGGVGGSLSDAWLPSDNPDSQYQKLLRALLSSLAEPGTVFAGFVQADGLNDAAQESQSWRANWDVIEARLRSDMGHHAVGKLWTYVELPDEVPTDLPYPQHAEVLADQRAHTTGHPLRVRVKSPPGPYREETHVHLDWDGNADLADLIVSAQHR